MGAAARNGARLPARTTKRRSEQRKERTVAQRAEEAKRANVRLGVPHAADGNAVIENPGLEDSQTRRSGDFSFRAATGCLADSVGCRGSRSLVGAELFFCGLRL